MLAFSFVSLCHLGNSPTRTTLSSSVARKASAKPSDKSPSANIGFEAKLWLAADKLRNNMDAAEYKHVVLGLIFLKYISDTFEEHRAKLLAGEGAAKTEEVKGARRHRPSGPAKRARRVRLRWQQPKQSSPNNTHRLTLINLSICGIEAALAVECAETLRRL